MFGWFKKKRPPANFDEIREKLFGDVPLDEWQPSNDGGETLEPWQSFALARNALRHGQTQEAIALLRKVQEMEDLEARQTLKAWHFLRQLGVHPDPGEAKRVRGVVLELHLPGGLDTLAAYSDRSARYINHGGRLIVWEASDEEMDRHIDALLQVGQQVAEAIGPSDQPRRGSPPKEHARLNLLTSSGLHFGEGPMAAPSKDPMGGALLGRGSALMRALIARATAKTS